MSLTYGETDNPIAYDKATDELISYDENKFNDRDTEAIGNFEIIPNIKMGYEVCFVCGAMGSGKSWWCSDYAEMYRKIYQTNHIFLFSQKTEDKAFDDRPSLKVRRIKFDDAFIKKEFDLTKEKDFHNSLIIIDDVSTIPNKKIIQKILQSILQFVTLGRQFHCYVLITSHMFYSFTNKELYASIQTEVNRLVWFRGVNVHQLTYVLRIYWGYENKQVRRWLKLDPDSRFTCINKMPAYLLTKHHCALI
jgi:hypothetical protein